MNISKQWLAALAGFVLAMVWLPGIASAAPLPAPSLVAPAAGATMDQPVFHWSSVEGAVAYEIEVALDDQFVTLVDPPVGATPQVPAPLTVYGTRYIPTRSYQAKTMYWHVRAIGPDLAKGSWSDTSVFTRRWTNIDEPAGTDVSGVPGSRVEGVRVLGGGTTPAINNLGITWEPVPGAAFYEVQISTDPGFPQDPLSSVSCRTPHTALTPYLTGGYSLRPAEDPCPVNSAEKPWIETTWERVGAGVVRINGTGVTKGDKVVVAFPPDQDGNIYEVLDVGPESFTIADPHEGAGTLKWYKTILQLEVGGHYFARVRAVDYSPATEYPYELASPPTLVFGMWSDHRREPSEQLPPEFTFTPSAPDGTGDPQTPAVPMVQDATGPDVPVLSWEPALGVSENRVVEYRVVIALDRDFTDVVAKYTSRSARLLPSHTFDDNGPGRTYFWYALPCTADGKCVADRHAINDPRYVATFAKHSAPVTGLSAQPIDGALHALLRWDDALTAAGAATPGGVSAYQLQITAADSWTDVPVITTDNLAYATTLEAVRPGGTYRWRVRPLDGDGASLAWAVGPDFTLKGPPVKVTPTPSVSPLPSDSPTSGPNQSSPNPTPSANYDVNPGAGGGTGNVVPSRPGKPKVFKVARNTVRVRWNASTAYSDPISGYLLMRSRAERPFKQVARTSARSLRLTVRPGEYRFYVVAVSAAGNSRPSPTSTFTMR